jgi:hypothetical protein
MQAPSGKAVKKSREKFGQSGQESVSSAAGTGSADSAEAEPAAKAAPEPMLQGGSVLGIGQTAVFADGAVRAFVSRVGDGGAVLSINGDASEIAAGDAVLVRHDGGTCRVGVARVSYAGVEICSDCDGALASEGGATAGPGQTVMLADAALRVFVSGVVGGTRGWR